MGIRIPKALLEECGFGEEVDLRAVGGALILRPARSTRANWAESFQGMSAAGDDGLVHEEKSASTQFDAAEWTW